jgi:hypothetical protein
MHKLRNNRGDVPALERQGEQIVDKVSHWSYHGAAKRDACQDKSPSGLAGGGV